MSLVIDSSVLIAAAVDSGPAGTWAESLLEKTEFLLAPQLILVEATNILRRLELAGQLAAFEAACAHRDLLGLDIELFPYPPLAARIWELRDNLTTYDAWYVAGAEALKLPLATLDLRLARAPGPVCSFLVPS